MKAIENTNEGLFQQWIKELNNFQQEVLSVNIALNNEQLLSEEKVCKLLGVCDRTMRRYRQQHLIHYVKISKQIYYLKFVLINDLLVLSKT